MNVARGRGFALAWLGLTSTLAAQGPAVQRRPLAFPIVVPAAGDAKGRALDCVVSFGPAIPLSAVAFSPDGKTLAVGGYQEVVVWDLANGRLARRIGVGQIADQVRAVAFRGNGQTIAVGEGTPYGPGSVKLLDAAGGQPVAAFAEPKDATHAVVFSPDGKLLAAGGIDQVVRVWSVDEKKLVAELKGHSGPIFAAGFSPDGKFLVSGGADRKAIVWEVAGWKLATKLDQVEPVQGVAMNANAELVVLAVGGPGDRMIRLRRRDNGQLVRTIDLGVPWPLGLAWAPAGNRVFVPLTDKTVRAYDPNSGAHVATLSGHADWVYAAALSPDGGRLATASGDGTVKLWHAGEGRLLATLVQLAPRTDEWAIVAAAGHVAAAAPAALQWRAANLAAPPDKIAAAVVDPESVKKALAGEKLAPPVVP